MALDELKGTDLGTQRVVIERAPVPVFARAVGEARGYRYFSFDDDVARAAAEADPVGYVADLPKRTILDEVQRVPALFTALKTRIDRDRTPGRFILTGSTNVLLVPRLADSLAGRLAILRREIP